MMKNTHLLLKKIFIVSCQICYEEITKSSKFRGTEIAVSLYLTCFYLISKIKFRVNRYVTSCLLRPMSQIWVAMVMLKIQSNRGTF